MRYFTDFIDGNVITRDEEGLEFCARHQACQSASEALVEMAHDAMRLTQNASDACDRGRLHLEVRMRDEAGQVVFRARLAMDRSDRSPVGR